MNTLINRLVLVLMLSVTSLVVVGQENTNQTANDPATATQPPAFSVDELLEKVKQGYRADQQVNAERVREFNASRSRQAELLAETQQARKNAENLSLQRETQFEKNELTIGQLQERLNERLGSLKELFGVLQLVANDAQGQFDASLIQIHYPERTDRLTAFSRKMGQTTELPTVEEIEALWFELQREITDSGKLAVSKQVVLTNQGQEQEMDVLRVGTFNLVAEGKYLQRISETGRIVEFARQPSSRYMGGVDDIAANDGSLVAFTVDPVRGQLISLLGAAPDMSERVDQGGVIGYIIISLGIVVVLVAILRYIMLSMEDRRIARQLQDLDNPGNNALGRIITVFQNNRSEELDALELRLGEAVLREKPKINRGLSFLKIVAAIAPLLGLLGTVTGMIITFQAITLFGAGDPKLMAGGISQALVTTVLGLAVAIPTLLLHNLVSDKAGKLSQIIEQEAVAMVALKAEQEAG